MELYERKSKFTGNLKAYCHHHKEHDYMEVTEWHNGEGFDVNIDGKQTFSLTWGEYECMQALVLFKG